MSRGAAEGVVYYPPHTWCRAYFSSRSKSMVVDNNFTESFNSWILATRFKPIISMLEDIRLLAMNRIKDNKKAADRWINDWSPTCMRLFQDWKDSCCGCKVMFNGVNGYEIGEGQDKHTVLLDKEMCTYRAWELTRIPCSHAIYALYHSKIDPITKICKWYHKSTYLAMYEMPIQLVPGPRFYKLDQFQPIEPPPLPKLAGRPRKQRVRAAYEPSNLGQ